ncbi:MAG: Amino acid transporter substrate-binding protein family [Bradyrhizobium sp.]|nr:Amino acid transporter substrate-binding protein family [Bradyrhizobium sp.]
MRNVYKSALLTFLRATTCLAFLAVCALCSARADEATCEPAKLSAKYPGLVGKTIKIGQDGESVPFSMRDPKDFSKLVGLDADLAQATFACIGVPMQFVIGTWSGLIPAAMSGQIDLMWDTLLYTPERAKKLDFVVYMNAATGMLVAKGNPKNIHALGDLCGLTGTTTLGTTQEAMLRDASSKCVAAGKPAVNIITSTDMPSGLRLVQNARADLVSVNKFVGESMIAANPTTIESAFDVITGAKIAVGTAKGNPDLVKALHDGLAAIRASGAEKAIYERYHVDYGLTTEPATLTE